MNGWIGVDLDGTLAHYDGWNGENHIGEPIPAMVNRVKSWLSEGREVRIFTARVYEPMEIGPLGIPEPMSKKHVVSLIERWCEQHIGVKLPVTNLKDYGMIELWDDRAVRVQINTGKPCCGDLI